jgi:threonine aldolase
MRQAGVIAAAGIVALESMVTRLAEDHANARTLAAGLASLPGVSLDPGSVQSNIVIFGLERRDMTPAELAHALDERGVRLLAIGGPSLRAVTHYMVDAPAIERALEAFRQILG